MLPHATNRDIFFLEGWLTSTPLIQTQAVCHQRPGFILFLTSSTLCPLKYSCISTFHVQLGLWGVKSRAEVYRAGERSELVFSLGFAEA